LKSDPEEIAELKARLSEASGLGSAGQNRGGGGG
jgi:hypothetical protein